MSPLTVKVRLAAGAACGQMGEMLVGRRSQRGLKGEKGRGYGVGSPGSMEHQGFGRKRQKESEKDARRAGELRMEVRRDSWNVCRVKTGVASRSVRKGKGQTC